MHIAKVSLCLVFFLWFSSHAHANLLEDLNSGDVERARRAIMELETLDYLPEGVVPSLFALWKHSDTDLHRSSFMLLKTLAEDLSNERYPAHTSQLRDILNELELLLKEGDSIARYNSLALVAALDQEAEPLVNTLVSLMKQDNGALRVDILNLFSSTKSLGSFQKHAVKIGPKWAQSKDSDSKRAFHILLLLVRGGVLRGEDARPVLYAGLEDSEPINRRLAAQALSNYEDKQTIQKLARALKDPWVLVQFAARDSLSEIGLPALDAARNQLNSKDPNVVLFAIEVIGAIYSEVNRGFSDEYPRDFSTDVEAVVNYFGQTNLPLEHRRIALEALAKMEKYAFSAQDVLLSQVGHEPYLQVQLIETLNAIALGLAEDKNWRELKSIEFLQSILPIYADLLNSDENESKSAVIQNVGQLRKHLKKPGAEEALSQSFARLLLSMLEKKRSNTETAALINALRDSYLYPDSFLPWLMNELVWAESRERETIEDVIASYKDDALPFVFPLLNSNKSEDVSSALSIIKDALRYGADVASLSKVFPRLAELAKTSSEEQGVLNPLFYVIRYYQKYSEQSAISVYIDWALKPNHGLQQSSLNILADSGAASADYLAHLLHSKETLIEFNYNHARTVERIATGLRKGENTQYLTELKKLAKIFKENNIPPEMQANLEESIKVMQTYREGKIEVVIKNYPLLAIAAPLLLAWVFVVLGLFLVKPLAVFRINESLSFLDVRLPEKFGGYSLPLRFVLLVGFFQYHPRVLDAWVAQHSRSVRERFSSKPTVRQRNVYVDLPVSINGQALQALKGEQLKRLFETQLALVMVWGEGGVGKTSLACHLAKLATSSDIDERVAEHIMIPVMIEHESTLQVKEEDMLELAVSQQIQDLCDLSHAPNPVLLKHLLAKKRILVIIDHLSEMSDATREAIKASLLRFPARALIVTSRLATDMDGYSHSIVRPMRIAGNRLSSFMEAYLSSRSARESFTDSEFFKSCSHLSDLVGEREITALLARLYAEEMISAKRQLKLDRLSTSVPDMILRYSNELNDSLSEASLSNHEVHQVAKQVAWCCVSDNLVPTQASLVRLNEALDKDAAEKLAYLSERLKLIQLVQPAADAYRFMLDPVAEYFAAMHLCEAFLDDESAWQALFDRIDAKPFEQVRGFVYALDDCLASMSSLSLEQAIIDRLKAYL